MNSIPASRFSRGLKFVEFASVLLVFWATRFSTGAGTICAAEDDYTDVPQVRIPSPVAAKPRIVVVQRDWLVQPIRQGGLAPALLRPQVVPAVPARAVVLRDIDVDRLVFGDNVPDWRMKMEVAIEDKLTKVFSRYELTEQERGKLLLASRADKLRFDRNLEEFRTRFNSAKAHDEDLTFAVGAARNLQDQFQNVSGSASFFTKALKKVTAGKSSRSRDVEPNGSESQSRRHREQIQSVVRALERSVEFRPSQRERLTVLMWREIPASRGASDFEEVIVKYRLSQLSHEKLRQLFDDDQWPKVLTAIEDFREFGPFLKHHRLLEDPSSKPSMPRNSDEPADAIRPESTTSQATADRHEN